MTDDTQPRYNTQRPRPQNGEARMKIDRKALVAALAAVRSTLPSKSPAGTPVTLDPGSGGMTLITTDYTSTSRVTVPVDCPLPSRVVVDHGTLLAAAGGSGEWRELLLEDDTLVVVGPKESARIPTIRADVLPDPVTVDGAGADTDAAAWADAVGRVLHSVCTDQSRTNLLGVHIMHDGDSIRMCTTDGHRLAVAHIPSGGITIPKGGILVPAAAMRASMIAGEGPLRVAADSRHISFDRGAWGIVSRLVDGTFPNVAQVVPQPGEVQCIDRAALVEGLRRAVKFAETTAIVTIRFEPGEIRIETGRDTAYTHTVPYSGQLTAAIGANANYLLDALGAADAAETHVEINGDKFPICIDRSLHAAGDIQIVMPTRL